ncbi:hypothetical protein ACFO4E_13215 [Nocardiopsis mangrovi]|uniref:Uncharacterized protein n=1 Tax=Nocardiopsis mangrovi TaxID=1179818 RepID=A0ABV9DVP3_9ACTN
MNEKNRTWIAVPTLCAAVVVAVMPFFYGWWTLLWAPLVLVVLGLSLVASGAFRRPEPVRPDVPVFEEALVPMAVPDPVHRHRTGDVLLRSAWPDYTFVFSAIICRLERAEPVPGVHRNPDALAHDLVLQRAAAIAESLTPDLQWLAGSRLAAELGEPVVGGHGSIEVWAEGVSLTVPEEDARRLRSLADMRKEKAVWEHQRARERDRSAYYAEEVLASQGSAIAWCLQFDPAKVRETLDLADTLGELSALVNGPEALSEFSREARAGTAQAPGMPPWPAEGVDVAGTDGAVGGDAVRHASALIDESVRRGGPEDRDPMTERLADVLRAHHQADTAQWIREKYEVFELPGRAAVDRAADIPGEGRTDDGDGSGDPAFEAGSAEPPF